MEARYTPRDPHFAIVCAPCRYGDHECLKTIEVAEGGYVPAGTYRCACPWPH